MLDAANAAAVAANINAAGGNRSRLVNITSMNGVQAGPNAGAYGSTTNLPRPKAVDNVGITK